MRGKIQISQYTNCIFFPPSIFSSKSYTTAVCNNILSMCDEPCCSRQARTTQKRSVEHRRDAKYITVLAQYLVKVGPKSAMLAQP